MIAKECAWQVQDTISGPRRKARTGAHLKPLPSTPSAFAVLGCANTGFLSRQAPPNVTGVPLARLAARPPIGTRAREALILEHADLVRRIGYRLVRRLPSQVEVDDLIQAGMVGLIEAARRYGPRANATFATFAGSRIRGAMVDFLRNTDWSPRLLHRRMREIEAASRSIRNRTGESPKPAGIADALGISLESYHRTLRDAADSKLLSVDHLDAGDIGIKAATAADDSANPAEGLEHEDLQRAVATAIESLPENEKLVLLLYYNDELRLHEIGKQLDVCESRVWRIRKRALERVRTIIERWIGRGGPRDR